MYEAFDNPYCYPGTSVLKNRLDLRTQTELQEFEAMITAQRSDEPLPAGRLDYDHYLAIHHHLFQDVYDWAGQIRTVRMSKQNNVFCYPEYIEPQMQRLFDDLASDNHLCNLDSESFAKRAAHFLTELNAIHPFREGNGRTQTVFLSSLANHAGHPADFDRLHPPEMLAAMIASFAGDEQPLADLILRLMRPS
jgi:cell filamentation protein